MRSQTRMLSSLKVGSTMSLTPFLTLVRLWSQEMYNGTNNPLDAEKPEEWDDEEDGDWIPPTVRNPACDEAPGCGEWKRCVTLHQVVYSGLTRKNAFTVLSRPTLNTRASGTRP